MDFMKLNKSVISVFTILEWAVVLLLLLTILATSREVVVLLWDEVKEHNLLAHYKMILSEILLLAVGIEIAFLIIKKDIYFVIDILILAIARKMITYEQNIDMLICVFSICLLLTAKVLKKRFLPSEKKKPKEFFFQKKKP